MTTNWVNAVRQYAKETGKWAVPRKGTPEYDAVKAIQEKMKTVPVKTITEVVPPVKKLGRKLKAIVKEEEPVVAEVIAPVKTKTVTIAPPKQEEAPIKAPVKKTDLKKIAPPVVKEPVVVEPPVKKSRKALRIPAVSIDNKKVILTFD